MNEDGTMARMADLVVFARKHQLKIGTIRDLIAYRRRHDHLVEKRAEAKFVSRWGGEWTAMTFWNRATATEQVALVKGRIAPDVPTLVRMHALAPFSDVFGEGERSGMLRRSMEIIAEAGSGIIVLISHVRPDKFTVALETRLGKIAQHEVERLRDYGLGATILAELGVGDMVLLTNTHQVLVALDGYGLSIIGERKIPL